MFAQTPIIDDTDPVVGWIHGVQVEHEQTEF
jgi:hypothetical protein